MAESIEIYLEPTLHSLAELIYLTLLSSPAVGARGQSC